MTRAYSYVRFSSKIQEKGDSLNRQTDLAEQFAKKHNLDLDNTSFQDLGVSAFKGLNVADGALGAFIQAVETGRIQSGSYLLIESLDRMSRNVISEAQLLLLRILNLDIVVVTLLDNNVYTKEKYNTDGGMSVLISLLIMIRAHEESKLKSKRVSDGWAAVIDGTLQNPRKIITKMCPAWLSVNGDEWVVNEKRADVIRRMFSLVLEGYGTPKIARLFNDEGIPTFTEYKEEKDENGDVIPEEEKEWSNGVVAHYLGKKSVYGLFETKRISARNNYFPVIVTEEVFLQVQHIMKSRRNVPSTTVGKGILNLLAGRSFCGICGSKMKSVSAQSNSAYIHCEAAYSRKCSAKRVPYTVFEEHFMSWLNRKNLDIFKETPMTILDVRPGLQAAITAKEKESEKFLDYLLTLGTSPLLAKRLESLEIELIELRSRLGKALPPMQTSNVKEIAALNDNYDYYFALNHMLRENDTYFYKNYAEHVELAATSNEFRGTMDTDEDVMELDEMYQQELRLHRRIVEDFGDICGFKKTLDIPLYELIKNRLNSVRSEIQTGLRRVIEKVEYHKLGPYCELTEGYDGKENGTFENYRVTFNSGATFDRWYELPMVGFQKGNKNGKLKLASSSAGMNKVQSF